jgi:hypothetical protein
VPPAHAVAAAASLISTGGWRHSLRGAPLLRRLGAPTPGLNTAQAPPRRRRCRFYPIFTPRAPGRTQASAPLTHTPTHTDFTHTSTRGRPRHLVGRLPVDWTCRAPPPFSPLRHATRQVTHFSTRSAHGLPFLQLSTTRVSHPAAAARPLLRGLLVRGTQLAAGTPAEQAHRHVLSSTKTPHSPYPDCPGWPHTAYPTTQHACRHMEAHVSRLWLHAILRRDMNRQRNPAHASHSSRLLVVCVCVCVCTALKLGGVCLQRACLQRAWAAGGSLPPATKEGARAPELLTCSWPPLRCCCSATTPRQSPSVMRTTRK